MSDEARELVMALYAAYAQDVFNYAYHNTHSVDACEELVQAVFTALCEKLERGETVANAKAWLLGAVRNTIKNEVKKRHSEMYLEEVDEHSLRYTPDMRPGETLLPTELPAGSREVLRLRIFEGFEYEEIAQAMKTTTQVVRQRYARAARQCREFWPEKIF